MPCEEAVELATHAVEADIAGDVAKAIEFYTRAADALDRAAAANAEARASADCRHGIATFLDTKAPPKWR